MVMHVLLMLVILESLSDVRVFVATSEIYIYIYDHVVVLVFFHRCRTSRLKHGLVIVTISRALGL